MRNESIEIHVNDFKIRNKKDIGWMPQCVALNYYPLAHIFDHPIFDDFQKLTEAEQKYMFDRCKIEIPTRIPEQNLREGIESQLGNMVSKKIMAESQREYPMDRHRYLVEDCTGSIKEKTGMPFTSCVYWKYGNSESDKLLSSLGGGDRKPLKNYIQEFMYGDKECLQSFINIILNEYNGNREEVLALRLTELCHHSLIELDEKTVYRFI